MRHLRPIIRACALIVWTLVMYAVLILGLPVALASKKSHAWRGLIFHKWAGLTTAILGLKIAVHGASPAPPFLLVSNHLSYVDVMVFASQLKCVFVARGDVAGWPVIGLLCRGVGTIFVDRGKRTDVARVNGLIEQALNDRRGVVMFPEGTSTRGDAVLPFKPSLLEQAARAGLGVSYAALSYRTRAGEPPAHLSVCWWGEMTFVKHVIGLLRLSEIHATVLFGAEPIEASDRKLLADRLWAAVLKEFVPVVASEVPLRSRRGIVRIEPRKQV
ncbi:MAG TPA: lysophospholipid acyltransferase family protein [Blastocatellia bacterium]|nr:lysophospholipid acyltransferase family protein [Blastocatellia bacterium]